MKMNRRDALKALATGAAALVLPKCLRAAEASPPTPARRVRDDGVILIDGKPFFPLGLYHDSLDAGYYGPKFLEDLKVIADAGFNLAHVSMDFTHDGRDAASSTAGAAARDAARRGLYLAVSVYLPNLPPVVAEHARWPAILMSTLGDDFNTDARGRLAGEPKVPPDRLRGLHEQVKRIAPHLLTYSSGSAYPGARLEGYQKAVDCIGIQCYPIGDGSQSPRNELEATDDVFASYWKLAGPQANPAMLANLQAFAQEKQRWPSEAEARLQTWTALLRGVKGILWYSFVTGRRDKPLNQARPTLWEELKLLVAEIRKVQPFLTDGRLQRFDNPRDAHFDDGEGTWHGGTWERDKKRLVVLVNTHRTRAADVEIRLDGKGILVPATDEKRYGRSLRWANGTLRGSVAPCGVEVCRIDGTSS